MTTTPSTQSINVLTTIDRNWRNLHGRVDVSQPVPRTVRKTGAFGLVADWWSRLGNADSIGANPAVDAATRLEIVLRGGAPR